MGMKKIAGWVIGLSVSASVAGAADINIAVTDLDGNSTITVMAGSTVEYKVEGMLTDADNEGLALVGFDLTFDGGGLTQADTPSQNPMLNFVRNAGIDNPAGYGGTEIDGDLVQIGGGQNTIKNTDNNADFPVGTVITGVAQSSQEFVRGSLTAPSQNGTFTRAVEDVFANQIKQGETGHPFWATEAVGIGTVGNLTIIVEGGGGGGDCGDSTINKAKCKTKRGLVKKLIVKSKKLTPGQQYTVTLTTGTTITKTAKDNGKANFKFKGDKAPPCGNGTATLSTGGNDCTNKDYGCNCT